MARTAAGSLEVWARRLVDRPTGPARTLTTGSGAVLVVLGDSVVKVHEAGTDPTALAARLAVAARPALGGLLLAPRRVDPVPVPPTLLPGQNRMASVWPRVDVLDVGTRTAPWRKAAGTLARLHATAVPAGMHVPAHGAAARLQRALGRLTGSDAPGAHTVRRAGAATVAALAHAPGRRAALVHGDWHLGQLGRAAGGDRWLLLDLDDLGLGDPAWDLGRPAGFWAAGLLADEHWTAFLDGYRAAGGTAVPPDGDPWTRLDLPARAEVVVAAARGVRRAATDGWDAEVEQLVTACARM